MGNAPLDLLLVPLAHRVRNLSLFILLCAVSAPVQGEETACPVALADATRLVLVTTDRMGSTQVRLQLFVRDDLTAPWQTQGRAEPATVGKKGLGWAFDQVAMAAPGEPTKQEDDRRTPAGIFHAGKPFGSRARDLANYLTLTPETVCIDDVASPDYNVIGPDTCMAPGTRHERMKATPLYRQGIVIDHATSREQCGGSCIFLHVWRSPGKPTVGCVAASEPAVKRVQHFLNGATGAFAILTSSLRQRYSGCGLPQ